MVCLILQHIIKVNFAFEYACDRCGCIFVKPKYVPFSKDYRPSSLMFKCLRYQFGANWEYEWYRLKAARSIVKAIRFQKKTKGENHISLKEEKMYTIDDFPSFGSESVRKI